MTSPRPALLVDPPSPPSCAPDTTSLADARRACGEDEAARGGGAERAAFSVRSCKGEVAKAESRAKRKGVNERGARLRQRIAHARQEARERERRKLATEDRARATGRAARKGAAQRGPQRRECEEAKDAKQERPREQKERECTSAGGSVYAQPTRGAPADDGHSLIPLLIARLRDGLVDGGQVERAAEQMADKEHEHVESDEAENARTQGAVERVSLEELVQLEQSDELHQAEKTNHLDLRWQMRFGTSRYLAVLGCVRWRLAVWNGIRRYSAVQARISQYVGGTRRYQAVMGSVKRMYALLGSIRRYEPVSGDTSYSPWRHGVGSAHGVRCVSARAVGLGRAAIARTSVGHMRHLQRRTHILAQRRRQKVGRGEVEG
eukprot:6183105-Pleurochrysis_carterae.AAC.2